MTTPFTIGQATNKGFYKGTIPSFKGTVEHKFQWTDGTHSFIHESNVKALASVHAVDEKELQAAIEASKQSIEEFYHEMPHLA